MIDTPRDTRLWRPQQFGRRSARQVADPVLEPLWNGQRVLVHVGGGTAEIVDDQGITQDRDRIAAAVPAALQATSAVLDGYLTIDAAQSGVGVYAGPVTRTPTPGEMARQMVIGGGRNRRSEVVEALEDAATAPLGRDDGVVFVAVDLLLIDDDPLLHIPLLERKRLLDAVIEESELVRRGLHVRVPVDPWLGTWRNLGFRQVAYKEANGRYQPGDRNDGWATAPIPRG